MAEILFERCRHARAEPVDFTELLALAHHVAEKHLVDTKNQLPPTWILLAEDGTTSVEVTPWRDDFDRSVYLATMRRLVRDRGIVGYVVLSEAWLSTHQVKPGDGIPKDAPPPRLDPKRIEVVVAMAVDRQRKAGRLWNIVRDYKGTVRMLRAEIEPSEAPMIGGQLTELFDG